MALLDEIDLDNSVTQDAYTAWVVSMLIERRTRKCRQSAAGNFE